MGEIVDWAAGGGEDEGKGFEDVDVDFIGSVPNIRPAPGNGWRCAGGGGG